MANVSVLNTTNQLSGKTIAVCENDQTISGAWTFTGNQAFHGNTTFGNAAGDTITVTGTLTSNLIFTDATYDIGASGATRPRDLFLSRNATVGGTLGVTGTSTIAALSATTGTFSSTLGVTGIATFAGVTNNGSFVLDSVVQAYSTDADVNNLALGATTSVLVGDAATVSRAITGLTGGTDGRVVMFLNRSGSSYTFPFESASSDTANGFRSANNGTVTVRTNGSVLLIYYGSRWMVQSV